MVLWLYLLIHNGADQLSDRGQWLVTGVKGHRLPGESNLEQKGHTVNGAPWVCAVGGRLAAIRKPAAKSGRRAGGRWWCGRGHVMRGGKERAWGCRGWAVVGRHWALFVTLSGQQRGIKWKRPSGSVSQIWFVLQSHLSEVNDGQRCPLTDASLRQKQNKRDSEIETWLQASVFQSKPCEKVCRSVVWLFLPAAPVDNERKAR